MNITRWVRASLVTCFVLACLVTNAYSQDAKINLSGLDKLDSKASNVVNVNLEGPLLQLAAAAMGAGRHGHPGKQEAARNMLQRLKGIYVRSYEFSQPGEYSRRDVQNVLRQLQSGGWTSVVNVDEKKEGTTTNVYIMSENGETVGIAVVAAEPKELTVVNLVGPIDFAQLGSLGQLGQLGRLGKLFGAPALGLQRRSQPQNGESSPAH